MKNDLSIRFIKALELLSKTAYQAAKELNTSDSNLSKIKQGRTPNAELLEKMVTQYPINATWLLTGKGNPMVDNRKSSHETPLVQEDKASYGASTYKIPVYDANTLNGKERLEDKFASMFFQTEHIHADFALKYHGKALSPDIQSGDLLFCRELGDISDLIYDELYLIQSQASVFVSYVHFAGSQESIFISSTSNGPKGIPYEVKNILKLYRIVAFYRSLSI